MLLHTPSPNLGAPAPPFNLPATDGRSYRLGDFIGTALIVVFTCNHCPYAQAVWPRLCSLAQKYMSLGINFVAINSNDDTEYPDDGFTQMQQKTAEWGIPFPYLRDASQETARAYGAVCTPDIFVYDRNRKLVYRGRFDDNWKDESKVTRHDLQKAIDYLLANKAVSTTQYPSMGCSIKWKK